jgi:YVTN family beta-propeller protein
MKSIAVAFIAVWAAIACQADEPYHFLKEIPISGEGGWDYLTVDSAAQRLYVSHATKVVVVDLSNDTVVGEVTNTPGVHGIAIYPSGNKGFVSDGRASHVSVFDLKTLQTLATVDTGANPDAILFEPSQKEVYTFNGRASSSTVLSADSGKVVATIPLDGKPEFAQADPAAGLVYDNIEDKSEIAVIHVKTHTVKSNWPIAPGESASGMAIDTANHRLFIGCENQIMEMIDASSGKVLANVPIGKGVDANAFDPGTKLAFASCGDGNTTIAREAGDKLTLVQTLKTEPSARTMAIDPATHKIYLASAKFDAPAPGQRRGKMLPGTFKILVYGTDQK